MEFLTFNGPESRVFRLRRRVRSFVDLAGDKGREGACKGKWWMVTLTYELGQDGESLHGYSGEGWHPRHIVEFLKRIKRWGERRGFTLPYMWVAELQERGVLHYHMWCKVPAQFSLPKPDKRGWWKHGSTNRVEITRSTRGYASKYAQKMRQKIGEYPRHARIFGCGGLPAWARCWQTWLSAPSYVRHECEPADCPRRMPGGFRIGSTFIPSPWVLSATVGPEVTLRRKTVDEWAAACADWQPDKTFVRRQSAWDRVEAFCDAMALGGRTFSNPFWAEREQWQQYRGGNRTEERAEVEPWQTSEQWAAFEVRRERMAERLRFCAVLEHEEELARGRACTWGSE